MKWQIFLVYLPKGDLNPVTWFIYNPKVVKTNAIQFDLQVSYYKPKDLMIHQLDQYF